MSFLILSFYAIPVILVSFLPCMLPGDIHSAPALGVVGIACMAKSPVFAICISVFLLFVVCDHGLVSLGGGIGTGTGCAGGASDG